ncbi:MAG: outer membrane protein assembly factor BamA [Deltaproteobacteria bacterium]|nr:outer membrane protein assembly factor BamA [Deltaproteobacteria bacterium]
MQIRIGRISVFCLVVSLFLVMEAQAQQMIDEIVVRGNRVIDRAMIALQIKSKAPGVVQAEQINADIKEIYRTGFFTSVSVQVEPSEGRKVLVFIVKEKPAIHEVFLEGNEEISEDTFKEKMGTSIRHVYDERRLRTAIKAVKDYYQDKGYYKTEVEFSTKEVDENSIDLSFVIKEGEQQLIREVVFEGNNVIDNGDLEDAIKTSEYKWWSSWLFSTGVVRPEELQNDTKQLTTLYLNKGYVDVRVTEPVVETLPEGLKVRFKIEEGAQYRTGNIKASGDLVENSQEKTLAETKLKSGEVFSVETLRKDVFVVSSKFTDVGYAFTNVFPNTKLNREQKLVDVDYSINKGSLVYIDRIELTGNKKTKDNVIRRSLKFEEGSLYSSSKVEKSQALLQRQGYFDEVAIAPDPSDFENKTNMMVSVKEGMTGTFTAGAGVSSGDGFIFSTKLAENNIFGTGRKVSLDMDTGSERQNYILSFDDPKINDTEWSGGIEGGITEREYDDFDRKEKGGSVTVGYPLWFLGEDYLDDVRFSLQYQLANIDISDVEMDAPDIIKEQEGKTLNSSITPKLIRNTINNPLDPTAGSKQTIGIELAGIGGDQEFWLLNISNTFYHELWRPSFGPFVFSHRVRFGYGETYDDDDFPVFRRFFPGGINSVRGYESRELGPKDENGNEYGGNKDLVTNFEMIFPLVESVGLRGLVFYDVGNAFDEDHSIDIAGLRQAVGFGLRWRSPLAPIRIEFGFPIDKEEGDKSMVTNFSFGMPQ